MPLRLQQGEVPAQCVAQDPQVKFSRALMILNRGYLEGRGQGLGHWCLNPKPCLNPKLQRVVDLGLQGFGLFG